MNNWTVKHKPYITNRKFLVSTGAAILFLAVSIVATFFAIVYATERASYPVTDIILSNIPVFDVDGIFIYGPVLFWIIIGVYLLFFEPRKIPFTLKSVSLFLVIRSAFISLTHIGPFPTHAPMSASLPNIVGVFTYGSDLFFSSHTGLPFLMSLVFWNNKKLRFFSLISSVVFGMVVLMAHLHYSIDVFAAFFITYTIFCIAKKLFKRDRQFFESGLEDPLNV